MTHTPYIIIQLNKNILLHSSPPFNLRYSISYFDSEVNLMKSNPSGALIGEDSADSVIK